MPNRDRVTLIKGTITLADGSTSEFDIHEKDGWTQWGADSTRLGRSVDVIEALMSGLQDNGMMGDT